MKFNFRSKDIFGLALVLFALGTSSAFADNTDEFARKAIRWGLDKRCDVSISHSDNVLVVQDLRQGFPKANLFADCDERGSKQANMIFCVAAVPTIIPSDSQNSRKLCEVKSITLQFDNADARPASLYFVSAIQPMKENGKCDASHAEKILRDARDSEKRVWSCDEQQNRY